MYPIAPMFSKLTTLKVARVERAGPQNPRAGKRYTPNPCIPFTASGKYYKEGGGR